MIMFQSPLAGVYTARTRNNDGTFYTFYTSCKVLGESDKSYLISVNFPVNGHKVHDSIKVRKHNVRVKTEAKAPTEVNNSEAWWKTKNNYHNGNRQR